MPGLIGHTDLSYPGWDLAVQAQARVDEWLKEFGGFVVAGRMPSVQFVYLLYDHTDRTTPGSATPAAMVADNDLALGRLVEAVSHSRCWPNTVSFVTEDDAQDGPDHVDGHRSLAFAISPYTQTGKVDSTFYSTVSILRSIELIAGVAPMTQFNALAPPMRAAFAPQANLRSYRARTPAQSLTEVNAADRAAGRSVAEARFLQARFGESECADPGNLAEPPRSRQLPAGRTKRRARATRQRLRPSSVRDCSWV